MENLRTRFIIATLGVVIGIVWFSPNVFHVNDKSWWPAKRKLNYGLDIQGGLHLVMGVDVAGVVSESSHRLANQLKAEFEKENVGVSAVNVTNPTEGELTVVVNDDAAKDKVVEKINTNYPTMLQVLNSDAKNVVIRYFGSYLRDYQSKVVAQSIETLRNRIDEFGVAEPSISAQGANRILVQLPGISDAERAKALIKTAARLEFRIVSTEKSMPELQTLITDAEKAGNYNLQTLRYSEYVTRLNDDLKAKLPEKTQIYFQKSENAETIEAGHVPYLLRTDTNLGGEDLNDAFVTFDEYGVPEVSLKFSSGGATKFADLTGANINHAMAIVLDKVIKTAPNIQGRIPNGQARITLGSTRDRDKTLNEAKMISTTLRAGALPAALEQLEERTVGPTLGQDALKRAELAGLVGAILIFMFMIARYKACGVVAVFCMMLNIFFILALLTSLGATLTLPGIAGIALTVGFAVDSNVLIYERVREELRHGSAFKGALKEGYHRAMSAILDANITTAGTAVVLLYFGTGPVKGFAVTLLIGIGATMFCNVFISHVIFDSLLYRFNMKKLSV